MSTKKKSETYVSKYRSLRLIRVSSYTKEINGKFLPQKGASIRFNEGAFITSDKEEIDFLDNHVNLGSVFIKVEKDAVEERANYVQTLEERNAELEAQISNKKEKETKVEKDEEPTVAELKEIADEKGVDITGLRKKEDIKNAIEKAEVTAKF